MTPREVVAAMGEAARARDWERLGAFFSEDFVNHASPFQGRDGMGRTLQAVQGDLEIESDEVHDTIAEGDKVVQRTTVRGRHVGSGMPVLAGVPVADKPFTWDFIHIWRVDDDLIAEHWACRDDLGLRRQLGADA